MGNHFSLTFLRKKLLDFLFGSFRKKYTHVYQGIVRLPGSDVDPGPEKKRTPKTNPLEKHDLKD